MRPLELDQGVGWVAYMLQTQVDDFIAKQTEEQNRIQGKSMLVSEYFQLISTAKGLSEFLGVCPPKYDDDRVFMQGAYLWRWKDRIDRTWMAKYGADLQPMVPSALHSGVATTTESLAVLAAAKMRCGGCGSKASSWIFQT